MDNYTENTSKTSGKRYEVSLFGEHLVESNNPFRKKDRIKKKGSLFYLGYVGQIGFVIALPIAAGAGIGSYLDTKWGSYPKMTLTLLSIGIIVSMVNFVCVIKEIITGSKN